MFDNHSLGHHKFKKIIHRISLFEPEIEIGSQKLTLYPLQLSFYLLIC